MRARSLPPGAAVLAVSLVGLALLSAILLFTAPPTVTLGELGANEGARVAIEARVLRGGETVMTLADETGRAVAFPPAGARAVSPGDEVRVVGIVTRGAGTLLLSLESLEVISRAPDPVLEVGDLARGIARYTGTPVAVTGALSRPAREGWRVTDPREGASLRVEIERVPEAWTSGLDVRLDGRVSLDSRRLDYAISVTSWTPS